MTAEPDRRLTLANDNLPKDVADAVEYLRTGGLGEVLIGADISMKSGFPTVQMDSAMAVALCLLASETQQK
jgi:hypothetical protein